MIYPVQGIGRGGLREACQACKAEMNSVNIDVAGLLFQVKKGEIMM